MIGPAFAVLAIATSAVSTTTIANSLDLTLPPNAVVRFLLKVMSGDC